jgi:hypothetical protein
MGRQLMTKLTRLEKEVKLSSTVTDKDVVTLLSNYRKIRAISTGVAAEYYLMQNSWLTILCLVQNIIGKKSMLRWVAEPLKDMLMSMRFRSKLDEKFMPRQSKNK